MDIWDKTHWGKHVPNDALDEVKGLVTKAANVLKVTVDHLIFDYIKPLITAESFVTTTLKNGQVTVTIT